MDGVIRDETFIEKDIWRFLSIVFDLERTNQLNLLPDKDLVDLCNPIEPYQVTKNRNLDIFFDACILIFLLYTSDTDAEFSMKIIYFSILVNPEG